MTRNDITVNEVADLYRAGHTYPELAEHFQCSQYTIGDRLQRAGVEPRSKKDYSKFNPDDIEQAYVLGVLEGDGYFDESQIVLRVKDKPFAESFSESLKKLGICATPHFSASEELWITAGGNVAFFEWLKNVDTEKFVLQDKNRIIAYVKGTFESDGTASWQRSSRNKWFVFTLYTSDEERAEFFGKCLDRLDVPYSIYSINETTPFGPCTKYSVTLKGSSDSKIEFLRKLNPCIRRDVLDD